MSAEGHGARAVDVIKVDTLAPQKDAIAPQNEASGNVGEIGRMPLG
jgi:hypothetical protein